MVQLMEESVLILALGIGDAVIVGGHYQVLAHAGCVRAGHVKVHIYGTEVAFLLAAVQFIIAQLSGAIEHYGVVDIRSLYLYPAHGLVVLGLLGCDLLGIGGGICRRGGFRGSLGGGDRRYYRLRRAGNYYIYYLIIFLLGAAYGQKAEGGHHKGNEFFHYAFILL